MGIKKLGLSNDYASLYQGICHDYYVSDIEQLRAENKRLNKALSKAQSELKIKDSRLAQLEIQLDYLKKKLFGTGKSEKLDPAQRELMLGQIERLEKQIESIKVPSHERKKSEPKPTRNERYENLPIEETVEIIPDEVKANPELYERTQGSEDTFEIDYCQAHFFRRRIVRPKFRLKSDRSQPLVIAPAPVRVVCGLASANLLALIMVSKFLDHLPLFRQAKIFKRQGCILAVESMVRWVEKVSDWIRPIYDQMSWELLHGNYLQADETPITFCDPDMGIKKSKKGYFCVYSRPDGHVVFVWRKGRSNKDVTGHLKGFKGLLQSDAYASYISFAKENESVTLLGCMAHSRRKFKESQPYNPRESVLVLKLMARLYKVEKDIRQSEPKLSDNEIVEKRKTQSLNTLERLHRLLGIIQGRNLPQEPVRKAADYAINNWTYLSEYVHHGQTQIDNNLVENAIRPTAIGKKNWLFIGHPNAGDRAAIIYSILISCERAKINPQRYLRFVLTQDTQQFSKQQLAKITPHAYAKSLAEQSNSCQEGEV